MWSGNVALAARSAWPGTVPQISTFVLLERPQCRQIGPSAANTRRMHRHSCRRNDRNVDRSVGATKEPCTPTFDPPLRIAGSPTIGAVTPGSVSATAWRQRTVALGRTAAGAMLPTLPVRLRPAASRSSRLWGWLGPLGVMLIAAVLRLWRLGEPEIVLFDETYYAKDAYSLLQHGYVREFTESANDRIVDGRLTGSSSPKSPRSCIPTAASGSSPQASRSSA
jgi:hypothetical protein